MFLALLWLEKFVRSDINSSLENAGEKTKPFFAQQVKSDH